MAERWFLPEKKVEKLRAFDGRTVHAVKFVNERGQMGWEARTWTDNEPSPELYWIALGEIREAAQPPDFKIGRFIEGMENTKRNILLNAISKWESEEIDKSCS